MVPASDDVRLKYANHDTVCMEGMPIEHLGHIFYWIELKSAWFQMKSLHIVRENIL